MPMYAFLKYKVLWMSFFTQPGYWFLNKLARYLVDSSERRSTGSHLHPVLSRSNLRLSSGAWPVALKSGGLIALRLDALKTG